MTMLAVTVTKNGAVLSQDSNMYQPTADYLERTKNCGVTRDFCESVKSCFPYQGDKTTVVPQVLGNCLKIMPAPRFGMAIACTGAFRMSVSWYFASTAVPNMDIVALNDLVPSSLREMRDTFEIEEPSIIVHAGYSRLRKEGVGFVYASNDDFQPLEVAVGETLSPSPDPEDVRYAKIAELWARANRGELVTDLHAELFLQQRRAFLAGKMGVGAGVGGDLNHVIVHPDGIDIRTAFAA